MSVERSLDLPVPVAWLCDPANWGYVSKDLVSVPSGVPVVDPQSWVTALQILGTHFRYQQYLSLQHPLAVLASPSVAEMMDPYRSVLARCDTDVLSFGVERDQVAVIDPERFRYFDRDGGWSAKFTLPSPGVLVTFAEGDQTVPTRLVR